MKSDSQKLEEITKAVEEFNRALGRGDNPSFPYADQTVAKIKKILNESPSNQECTCEPGIRTRSMAEYQCPECEELGRRGKPTVCLHESDCPRHCPKKNNTKECKHVYATYDGQEGFFCQYCDKKYDGPPLDPMQGIAKKEERCTCNGKGADCKIHGKVYKAGTAVEKSDFQPLHGEPKLPSETILQAPTYKRTTNLPGHIPYIVQGILDYLDTKPWEKE